LIQVATGPFCLLKILKINRDQIFGGHYHKNCIELFYVHSGRINYFSDTESKVFTRGESFIVEPYEKHSMMALEDSELIEVADRPYDPEDTYA